MRMGKKVGLVCLVAAVIGVGTIFVENKNSKENVYASSKSFETDLDFKNVDKEIVENSLWLYPDSELLNNSDEIVLLVNGKDNTGFGAWSWSYAAQLPKDGFVPATITLPSRNTTDLQYSGKFVAAAVWLLKDKYPDHKVSIVAHSMGNLATAWALHYRPTFMSKNVETYVALGAPFQGLPVIPDFIPLVPAIRQATRGSDFLARINSSAFPNGINYLSVISKNDELTTSDDVKSLATLPEGTEGETIIPQEFYNKPDSVISHVGEMADNGIYELAKAFLNDGSTQNVDLNAANEKYYPALEIEGLELTEKYGTKPAHAGDAPIESAEPKDSLDTVQ
ncbi:hypothetical protein BAU14_07370 [Enterococcus sp. CU9D]|nr:hypothetical protein BAU14_07370 [Enterococcus sp. CU9D]